MSRPTLTPPWLEFGAPLESLRIISTTRFGGVSQSPYDDLNLGLHVGDDPAAVTENRARLRLALPNDPVWINQVHGTRVLDADAIDPSETFEADAMVTRQPRRVLAIQTADCLPIVISAGQEILGVAHAGWRGLAKGVLPDLIGAMRHKAASLGQRAPLQWRVWIGPCIGPAAFEVGQVVYDAFVPMDPECQSFFSPVLGAPHKWFCDLPGLAIYQCQRLGIEATEWCGLCTVDDVESRFFSYRKQGRTGRMATLAWLDRT